MRTLLIALALCASASAQPRLGQSGIRISALNNRHAIGARGLVAAWDLSSRNLLLHSEDFSQAAWQKVLASASSGEITLEASADAYVWQNVGIKPAGTYMFSVELKAAGADSAILIIQETGIGATNLNVSLTSEWRRFSVSLANSGAAALYLYLYNSSAQARTFQARRAQLHSGTLPLPYAATGDQQSVAALNTAAYPLQRGSSSGADSEDPSVGTSGLSFDGGDYATSGLTSVLNDITAVVVFKDTGTRVTYERLIDKDADAGFAFSRNYTLSNAWGSGIRQVASPYGLFVDTFTDGSWMSIATTRAGAIQVLYANGVSAASQSGSSDSTDNTTLRIGATQTGTWGLTGEISTVLVYSIALSPAEMLRTHRALRGPMAAMGVTLP